MFGLFKPTSPLLGGLLWKNPWRISSNRKLRQRARLRRVDKIVAIVDRALARVGHDMKSLDRWKAEMPTEAEMLPRDKYTMFDKKEKTYRKGVHKLPKWTRVSQRLNPPGF
ncbi:mitochondrial ribosomal protein L31 [Microthyrium microscopicum]|uniref:Large ribosomal subunit protein mL60 n=1 Tax=Microthyrium microscopicum TaxID=703497 RepID=A0A6A6ULM2_9PEZI|nr:mitochondrial ribosomal protein L31 [Microthyrium microscopicum]